MKLPEGKALFYWQPTSVEAGNVTNTVKAAVEMGLSMVSMKVGSGAYNYPFNNYDLLPLRNTLGEEGIRVFGWHYVYGTNTPLDEARIAEQRIDYLDLDGYEIDAESHYKNFPDSKASDLVDRIKEHCERADIPLGLTTYRYPDSHPEFPWRGFLQDVDYYVPQVYWQPSPSGPVLELDKTISQWNRKLLGYGYPRKPFFPAGRVYIGDGYPLPGPSASEITAFMARAKELGMPGITFWSFDNLYTHAGGAVRKDTIEAFEWKVAAPPDDYQEQINAINLKIADHETRLVALENEAPAPEPEPEPEPGSVIALLNDNAPAFSYAACNDKGRPIMDINVYQETNDPKLKWVLNDRLWVRPTPTIANGGAAWHEITAVVTDSGAEPVNKHGYPALYVRADKIN